MSQRLNEVIRQLIAEHAGQVQDPHAKQVLSEGLERHSKAEIIQAVMTAIGEQGRGTDARAIYDNRRDHKFVSDMALQQAEQDGRQDVVELLHALGYRGNGASR